MNLSELDQTPASKSPRRDVSAYHVGGVRVPSVTEILELAGLTHFDNIPALVLKRAAARGSLVHALCDVLESDDLIIPDLHPEIRGFVEAFDAFRLETGFDSMLIERSLVSERYRFAGTPDRFGLFQDQWTVLDIKTPIATSETWPIQTFGYAVLSSEAANVPIDQIGRVCLQLKSNGRYEIHRHLELERDEETFFAAKRVAEFRLAAGAVTLED